MLMNITHPSMYNSNYWHENKVTNYHNNEPGEIVSAVYTLFNLNMASHRRVIPTAKHGHHRRWNGATNFHVTINMMLSRSMHAPRLIETVRCQCAVSESDLCALTLHTWFGTYITGWFPSVWVCTIRPWNFKRDSKCMQMGYQHRAGACERYTYDVLWFGVKASRIVIYPWICWRYFWI